MFSRESWLQRWSVYALVLCDLDVAVVNVLRFHLIWLLSGRVGLSASNDECPVELIRTRSVIIHGVRSLLDLSRASQSRPSGTRCRVVSCSSNTSARRASIARDESSDCDASSHRTGLAVAAAAAVLLLVHSSHRHPALWSFVVPITVDRMKIASWSVAHCPPVISPLLFQFSSVSL